MSEDFNPNPLINYMKDLNIPYFYESDKILISKLKILNEKLLKMNNIFTIIFQRKNQNIL